MTDTFIAFVTGCTKVGEIRLGESVYKIIAVRFFSLTGNTPDEDMIPAPQVESLNSFESEKGPSMMPHPCKELEKVLCNGAFYFSPQFDLTRSLQTRSISAQNKHPTDTRMELDESYLWNYFMLKELLSFRSHLEEQERDQIDAGGLLVHVIQGYVGSQSFRTANTQGELSVISRLSSRRAGTRYNTRGIDDTGNVANFVETETILSNAEWCFSYTQIRGSVPVFWEQQGLQLASHKIQLSRGTEATKPAVRRHFEELVQKYEDVHIIDLLGIKDQGEMTLSQEYKNQIKSITSPLLDHLHMTKFDFHSEVKGGNYDQVQLLLQYVKRDSERYGYFYHDLVTNTIVQKQRGVFRTNCLDCLDRTNVVQSNLSKEAIESLLHNLQYQRSGSLLLSHSQLWASNGDMLSKIYTGTGALKSEVTRSGKMSFGGLLSDATKSINRFYINNFQDKDRQETIDVLLGKMANQTPVVIYDPVHDSIASEMSARLNEYSQKVQVDVFVGTYNLNGKAPSGESLEPWLCFDKTIPEPDLYVIGFQEIVKLTPKQIMATDENKRIVWEKEVERTINRRGGAKYIQLRSGQLVGAALMIYAKEKNAPHIRNIECTIKKIRSLVSQGNYFEIYRCDQLRRSIDYGEAFEGYKEGIIAFAPSYRYDIGTDNYDTSEKYRAPAWTDRILYKGEGIYQTSYERAELRTSDHRPVMSMFVLELTLLDAEAKEKMEQMLYRKSSSRSLPGSIRSRNGPSALGPNRGLQKPSSDEHQWWNDPLEESVKRIPSKNTNPFIGDRFMTDTSPLFDRMARSTTMPSRRPTPPLPSTAVKAPAVDLLGGKSILLIVATVCVSDVQNFNSPVLGQGASVLNIKRAAPPPPVGRKFTPLPASSSLLSKDQVDSSTFRRPAPPPPRKTSTDMARDDDYSTDDDDDDDDEDDSDNDDDNYVDAPSNTGGSKDTPTSGPDTKKALESVGQSNDTVPLKSSAVKKDPSLVPGSRPVPPVPGVYRGGTQQRGDHHSSSSSISSTLTSSSASNTSAGQVPASSLAAIAANKSKMLLPTIEPRTIPVGGEGKKVGAKNTSIPLSSPSVASLGLSPAGSLQRPLNTLGHLHNVGTAHRTTLGSESSSVVKESIGEKEKKDNDNEEEAVLASISVSALKKTFGASTQPSVSSGTVVAGGGGGGGGGGDGKVPIKAQEEAVDDESIVRGSCLLELKKSYGVDKLNGSRDMDMGRPVPSVAARKKSYSPVKVMTKDEKEEGVEAKEEKDGKENTGIQSSISELTKSYGVGVVPVAGKGGDEKQGTKSHSTTSTATTVAALKKEFDTSKKGIISPQLVKSKVVSGSVGAGTVTGGQSQRMVKMAGMGPTQTKTAEMKGRVGFGELKEKAADEAEAETKAEVEARAKAKAKTEVEGGDDNIMPANSSVKNAIASLKGGHVGSGTRSTTTMSSGTTTTTTTATMATGLKTEGADQKEKDGKDGRKEKEEDRVDAFAFWKSK
ncbi:inositol polyphosphate 5-phosphatase [Podila epigama]|nr:inositol polyphosphate 5-phosphatase [Podila epigama]